VKNYIKLKWFGKRFAKNLVGNLLDPYKNKTIFSELLLNLHNKISGVMGKIYRIVEDTYKVFYKLGIHKNLKELHQIRSNCMDFFYMFQNVLSYLICLK
jgi:hypothetical protein